MLSSPEEAWPAVAILAEALRFARPECLELVKRHWMVDPHRDTLTWRVLERLEAWDENSVGLACCIARRADISPFNLMSLAMLVSTHEANLAPRVVRASLERSLDDAERQPAPEPPERRPDESDEDFHVRCMLFKPKERFENLLDARQGWNDLPAVADAAPGPYIDQLWPWLARTLAHLELHSPRNGAYKGNYSLANGLDPSEGHRENPIAVSFDTAVRKLAVDSPPAFLQLLSREQGRDSQLVQRLLCRGLTTIATSHARTGLEYLKGDPRRFRLGPFGESDADTKALIAAIVPQLNKDERGELESAILASKVYEESVESNEPEIRFEASKWNREHRLRLLKAFPEGTLSRESQRLVEAETLALPNYLDREVRIMGGLVGSPMAAEQMSKAKDEHIKNLFDELVDPATADRPRDSSRDFLKGGIAQASHEFGRFAKERPRRALALIQEFEPKKQEQPVSAALQELAKSEAILDQEFFDLLVDLDRRGFTGEDYRSYAAMALWERCRDGTGLPDNMCELLEKWRTMEWTLREENESVKRGDNGGEKQSRSILWQDGGMFAIPQGSFNVLHTLTFAYLLRKPPEARRWLAMLRDHLERPERVATWRVLARDLKYLRHCDRTEANEFVRGLFARFPDVRDTAFGAGLITHLWGFVDEEVIDSALIEIRDGQWSDGAQVYGELLSLRFLRFPNNKLVKEELFGWLLPEVPRHEKSSAIRLGIAYAAVHMWNHPETRQAANDLLIRLIPVADDFVAEAIVTLFWVCNDMPADEITRSLLRQIVAYPDVLKNTGDNFLVEHLEQLLPWDKALVLAICEELVRLRGKDLLSIQTSFTMSAPHLTNIALTLQRTGGEYRTKGLKLFEQLLVLGVQDAQSALNELDRRPILVPPAFPRRRRRRRP
jgi:hypothetical protein